MESENPSAKEHDPEIANTNSSQGGQTVPQLPPTGSVPPIQTPPAPNGYQITYKTEKDWHDKVKFWAELVGILFLLLYTCETRRTNNLTQMALTQSQNQFTESQASSKTQFDQAQSASLKQFITEQRPYVWRADPTKEMQQQAGEPGPYLKAGRKAEWRIYYSNYGKSQAIGVMQKHQVEFGPNAVSKLRRQKVSDVHSPGDRRGSILAPGQTMFMSAFSKTDITLNDETFIGTHDGGLAVLVHFEYFDTYGNTYHSYICELTQANGVLAACDAQEIQ